ncbi:MAG TPA: glycosyltransferase family 4 protein [Longimicrobium sp.]|nr:glycosyltransferase family 4 protein [Longimicrobium sp.]
MAEGPGVRGRRRPCVTLFVHDLAANPIVRASPLAQALERDFRVEMVGLLLSGEAVYAPFRERYTFRTLRSRPGLAPVLAAAPRLARMAMGDVLYACKPLFSTLLPAVLAARGGARPLLLDVEDDEWASTAVDIPASGARGVLQRLADTHGVKARLAHPLARRAAAVTVSTRALQRRHGGVLVRHGPDAALFDPARPGVEGRDAVRCRLGLPAGRRIALFAGRPRPQKGWATLLDALELPAAAGWDLALAGPAGAMEREAARRLGRRFHALGLVGNDQMPGLLAAADAVPVPQRDEPFTRGQLPAKALEAMAMAVPVVATAVGDLPEILGGGERGWLVPPGDAPALADALAAIAAGPAEAARRAAAARRWFVDEASVEAIRARLVPLVEAALAGRASAPTPVAAR